MPLETISELSIDEFDVETSHSQQIRDQEQWLKFMADIERLDKGILETNRNVTIHLLNDVDIASKREALLQPSAADQAERIITDTLSDEPKVVKVAAECLTAHIADPQAKALYLMELLEQEKQARAELIPDPVKSRSRKKWIIGGVAGTLVIAGILLIAFRKQIWSKASSDGLLQATGIGEDIDLVPDSILNSEQNYLSLLMQAAADRPINFADFGISSESYGLLRQLLLTLKDELSEENHWQMQAEQSRLIYPATQKPPTLGDHLVSLDVLFTMLEPLYPVQPIDLDLDQAISSLAGHIDLTSETPMVDLYQAVMDVAPETTGASRLQRILLVRAAIARAVTQAKDA